MLDCERCQRFISDNATGHEMPSSVTDHIAGCRTCAAVLADERLVRTTLAEVAWPASPLGGDLQRLATYVAGQDAERRARRQRVTRHWVNGLGLLAVVGLLGVWVAFRQGPAGEWDSMLPAVPIGFGIAAWVWLEVIGRRLAMEGATPLAQFGLGVGRAAIGLALVVAVIDPSRWAELPYTIARMAGGPAEAHGAVFEAELVCAAGVDGRLRLARASEGCRAHEVAVSLDGRAGSESGRDELDGLSIRFGTATLPAGDSALTVTFAPPMSSGSYQVLFTPHNASKPTTVDDACHVIGIGGKSTTHFSLDIRRCWFEGIDVPHDWAASDITVDWVVIGR